MKKLRAERKNGKFYGNPEKSEKYCESR